MLNNFNIKPASSQSSDRFSGHSGVTLVELLVVIAIIALLIIFVPKCTSSSGSSSGGSSSGSLAGSATISATLETIKVAAKNLVIASAPITDCKKAAALAADVAAAQTKINNAARDYPQDYAANKSTISREVDKVNQGITLYNHDCKTSIPLITLPP